MADDTLVFGQLPRNASKSFGTLCKVRRIRDHTTFRRRTHSAWSHYAEGGHCLQRTADCSCWNSCVHSSLYLIKARSSNCCCSRELCNNASGCDWSGFEALLPALCFSTIETIEVA
jgi:hypothetical protein